MAGRRAFTCARAVATARGACACAHLRGSAAAARAAARAPCLRCLRPATLLPRARIPAAEAAQTPAAASVETEAPQAPLKSSREALEFACERYGASLAMSPAARRQVEEAERVTEQALERLKEIEGTLSAVRRRAAANPCVRGRRPRAALHLQARCICRRVRSSGTGGRAWKACPRRMLRGGWMTLAHWSPAPRSLPSCTTPPPAAVRRRPGQRSTQ